MIQRCTPGDRFYKAYEGPDGKKAQSRVHAWRVHEASRSVVDSVDNNDGEANLFERPPYFAFAHSRDPFVLHWYVPSEPTCGFSAYYGIYRRYVHVASKVATRQVVLQCLTFLLWKWLKMAAFCPVFASPGFYTGSLQACLAQQCITGLSVRAC